MAVCFFFFLILRIHHGQYHQHVTGSRQRKQYAGHRALDSPACHAARCTGCWGPNGAARPPSYASSTALPAPTAAKCASTASPFAPEDVRHRATCPRRGVVQEKMKVGDQACTWPARGMSKADALQGIEALVRKSSASRPGGTKKVEELSKGMAGCSLSPPSCTAPSCSSWTSRSAASTP